MSSIKKQIYKKIMQAQYIRGKYSPTYAVETYMKTYDQTQGGFVKFKLFPKQKDIIRAYDKNRFNLVTKPRQTGISTTTAAYLAVKIAYAPKDNPETVVVIANKFKLAKKLLKAIKDFIAQLPAYFWKGEFQHNKPVDGHIVGKGSTEEVTFVNGSKLIALATSPDALRGFTPTYLVLDEAAYIEINASELYTAAIQSLNTGGNMMIVSTPNGKDELYYKTYKGAQNGDNDFNIVDVRWYHDPRYNIDMWWEKVDRESGKTIIEYEQEYTEQSFNKRVSDGWFPNSNWRIGQCRAANYNKLSIAKDIDVKFEGSAGTVIEQEFIDKQTRENVTKPIVRKEHDKLHVFVLPEKDEKYIMGVDVASGNSEDYSTFVIIRIGDGKIVVSYKHKIRPEHFADIVNRYGRLYSSLTVVDTTGGYGDLLIHKLTELDYPHIYYSDNKEGRITNAYNNISNSQTKLAGIKIGMNRNKIIGNWTTYTENNALLISDSRLISELDTFVWVNGRADHMSGFNDDLIFATALACWVLETNYKEIAKAKSANEAILNAMLRSKSQKRTNAYNNRVAKTKRRIQNSRYVNSKYNDKRNKWLLDVY